MAISGQTGDSHGHDDTVVPVTMDVTSSQACSYDNKTIGEFSDISAQFFKFRGHHSNPVRFFHSGLFYISEDCGSAGETGAN